MAGSGNRLMSFVTEQEIEETKKKRQEEWEKVRKPDDPIGEFGLLRLFMTVLVVFFYSARRKDFYVRNDELFRILPILQCAVLDHR